MLSIFQDVIGHHANYKYNGIKSSSPPQWRIGLIFEYGSFVRTRTTKGVVWGADIGFASLSHILQIVKKMAISEYRGILVRLGAVLHFYYAQGDTCLYVDSNRGW